MKRVTVTFDFEGKWGMPFAAEYDLAATTNGLLETLAKYNAKAVFFVTAKLVTEHPEVMKQIHAAGHEIGLHGYEHEHMHALDAAALAKLEQQLRSAGDALEQTVGVRPVGFRAPYLMGPKFYDAPVYEMLKRIGMEWVSNREIRMPEELARPDRLPWAAGLWRVQPLRMLALLALNAKLALTERPDNGWSRTTGWYWLTHGQRPFVRPEGLVEYPLYSPLDCDLFGFPEPQEDSGAAVVDYAAGVVCGLYDQSADYFNINCHDWITGTADRLQVLDRALKHIAKSGHAQYFLPGRDGGEK